MAAKKNKLHKKHAHPWAFPLGLLIVIFTVVGIVFSVIAGVNGTKKLIRKNKNIAEYNKMLIPVVMNDPDPFDDLTKANQSQLIDISIWSILKNEITPDKYEYSDGGMMIPEADVTAEYEKLFGKEVPPVHATVNNYGYEFVYDAAKQMYTIPLTGMVPIYTPSVVDVEKKNNTIVLTVGYLAGDQWAQNEEGEMVAPEPDKYMKITMREKDGTYYISAIQSTSAPEIVTTAPAETPAPVEESSTEAESTDVAVPESTEVEAQVA